MNEVININYGRVVRCLPIFVFVQNTHTFIQKKYRAIFDTGATNSVISQNVFNELLLFKLGDKSIASANRLDIVPFTVVNIILPNNFPKFKSIKVPVLNLPNTIDVLLGMDVITKGNFYIDNDAGTILSFVCNFLANNL